MSTADAYRSGTFAVFQGRTYPADAKQNIRGEITLLPEGGPAQLVGIDELEDWFRTSWTFVWEGQPFSVLGVEDGKIKGQYKGGSHRFAWELLDREPGPDGEREIYVVRVDPQQAGSLTEHREDLLTQWKEERQP
jgi:hypothetical protein